MDNKDFDSKRCLLVKIEPEMSAEDVETYYLEMYMEKLTGNDNNVVAEFNGRRNCAVIKFDKPISDINELQKRSDEKSLEGYKVTFETIPSMDKVLVTGLPLEKINYGTDMADSALVLYFESKTYCPDGGDVADLKMLPCRHAAVVQFNNHAVPKKLKTHHRLDKSDFTVTPLNIFECVEGPCCSVCKDKDSDSIVDDTEQASWHSAHEDTVSQKNETQSGSQSNSDMDEEDMNELRNWSSNSKGTDTKSQRQNEHSSFTGEKCSPRKKFSEPGDCEITELLLKTIRCRRIPGLIPEEYDMIKLSKSKFEILEHDKQKKDHIRKVTEDALGLGEVDLSEYTKLADKLNSNLGRKWITELLDDLKIPAELKYDKSTLSLRAINLQLAEEAAKTVAISLLPARIKCDQNQMSKCSKVLQGKIVIPTHFNSGYLELLGIPMDVLKALNEIEKLNFRLW